MSVLTASSRALPVPDRYDAPGVGLRVIATLMLLVEIAIHAYLAPDHVEEVPYIGWGFVISVIGLLLVMVGNLAAPRHALPWQVGATVCIGMAALFVVSRTVGLPGYQESWTADNNLGLIALAGDVGYVAAAWWAVNARRGSRRPTAA